MEILHNTGFISWPQDLLGPKQMHDLQSWKGMLAHFT